jgi:hypothetical protein
MRKAAALLLACVLAAPAWGQKVTLPAKAEVKPGLPTLLVATADGANVTWLSPDADLAVIDGTALGGDSKRALLFGNKQGVFRVWAVTARGDKVSERAECLVTVGTPPEPPPGPTPPGPDPPPRPGGTFSRALILYESAETGKMPLAQQNVLYDSTVRASLDAKCAPDAGGKTKAWKIWDKDVDASGEGKAWQDLMARPRASVPWIILANDAGVVYEGPLPATVADTLALLAKYGPKSERRKAG